MNIPHAIQLIRETCALRHFSFKTEKTYAYWVGRYGVFLKDQQVTSWTTEQKVEAILSRLAKEGVSASTQNQGFNAVLFFYRDALKQEPGPVSSCRPSGENWLRGLDLNQRPSGYEPDELPGCSTPRFELRPT